MYCFVLVIQVSARVFPRKDYGNFCQVKDFLPYVACNDKKAFFISADHYRGFNLWSCQNVCDALSFFLDNKIR